MPDTINLGFARPLHPQAAGLCVQPWLRHEHPPSPGAGLQTTAAACAATATTATTEGSRAHDISMQSRSRPPDAHPGAPSLSCRDSPGPGWPASRRRGASPHVRIVSSGRANHGPRPPPADGHSILHKPSDHPSPSSPGVGRWHLCQRPQVLPSCLSRRPQHPRSAQSGRPGCRGG